MNDRDKLHLALTTKTVNLNGVELSINTDIITKVLGVQELADKATAIPNRYSSYFRSDEDPANPASEVLVIPDFVVGSTVANLAGNTGSTVVNWSAGSTVVNWSVNSFPMSVDPAVALREGFGQLFVVECQMIRLNRS